MKANYLKFLAISLCMVPFACTEPDLVEEGNASIELNPTEYTAEDYGQQTFAVTVTANCKWSVTTLDASGARAGWLQTDTQSGEGNGTFNVRLLENTTADERTARVSVSSSSNSEVVKYIEVIQPGNPDIQEPEPTPVEGYSFPIIQMWDTGMGVDVNSGKVAFGATLVNATIAGNTITFDDGMVIERSGTAAFDVACPAHTNPKSHAGFQIGITAYTWTGGEDYWLIKIPVKEDLSGDFRFCYGSRKDKGYTITWSSDEGKTWNNFTGEIEASLSDATWKSIKFSIPESNKIVAKNYLWIKMVAIESNDSYNMLANGVVILPAEAELSEVPEQDNSSVVFSEGFDDLVGANAMYIDIPVGFMKSWTGNDPDPTKNDPYVSANPAVETNRCYEKPGFLQIGYADESRVVRYLEKNNYGNGSFKINVGKRLEEMGKTTADLTVKFKCAGITTAYGFPVDAIPTLTASTGTVENGTIENLSMDEFKEYSMTVKGADKTTVLTLTSAHVESSAFLDLGLTEEADYRFFVDDIVVTIAE